MYRQTWEQWQRMLGPEHPDTIDSINNVAVCIHAMGRWAGSDVVECCWGEGCLYHLYGVRGRARQAAAGLSGPERVVVCDDCVCMNA